MLASTPRCAGAEDGAGGEDQLPGFDVTAGPPHVRARSRLLQHVDRVAARVAIRQGGALR